MFPGSVETAVTGGRGRVVYSSTIGRICPKCGWPEVDCRCSARLREPVEPVPGKITARLSVEKRGSGKVVTVISSLPENPAFLEEAARELKRSCGAGGRVTGSSIEIQGDHRERLRELLARKGWTVKG